MRTAKKYRDIAEILGLLTRESHPTPPEPEEKRTAWTEHEKLYGMTRKTAETPRRS